MSKHTQQKLRDAFEARMTDNGKWPRAVEQGRNGCYLLAQTENAWVEWQACAEALATTEPEPTGMPEFPPLPRCMYPNMQHQRMYIGNVYTADQMRTYGEQCWKAGYKHGAWGDKPEPTSKQSLQVEPAVNQQLTTELDEREAFEREMSCEEIWGHRSLKKKPDGRYANWCVDLMWATWQARAALAARKPLSDDQMWLLWNSQGVDDMNQGEAIAFARTVESAHGINDLEVKT